MAGFITMCLRGLCSVIFLWSVTSSAADSSCFCIQELLSNLKNPVHVESTRIDGSYVYLIAEQSGNILKYRKETNKLNAVPKTYLDLTNLVYTENTMFEENGLLSFALHPDFSSNQRIFIYSVRNFSGQNYAVVSEIVGQDTDQEKLLLLIEQPGNLRNGGQVLFGGDGYLYVVTGDGGPSLPEQIQAQDGKSLLGKVLRLDVSKTVVKDNHLQYYDIPHDNPNRPDWKPEVFAIGVRNMWRCNVDKGGHSGQHKGRIFCGDLGTDVADEMNLLHKGANYGWPAREGYTCSQATDCQNISGEVLPIYAFNRSTSGIAALVTGPTYRAPRFPALNGNIIIGDFITGSLQRLEDTSGGWKSRDFSACNTDKCSCNHRNNARTHLLSIDEDDNGELLLLMTDSVHPSRPRGALLRLVPPPTRSHVTCEGAALSGIFYLVFASLLISTSYMSLIIS